MAFVLDIDGATEQLSASLFEAEDDQVVSIRLGHDDETHDIYTVVVALVPSAVSPPGHQELHFDIVEYVASEAHEHVCNDGQQTKRFLHGEHRKTTLSCICSVSRELVRRAQPELVSMVTVETYLPEPALRKYLVICDAIREVGYNGGRVDSYLGSEMWILQKST